LSDDLNILVIAIAPLGKAQKIRKTPVIIFIEMTILLQLPQPRIRSFLSILAMNVTSNKIANVNSNLQRVGID
jgi:hypothetical protein